MKIAADRPDLEIRAVFDTMLAMSRLPPLSRLKTPLPALSAACLLLLLAIACGGPDKTSDLPDELLERRAQYDTGRSWSDLVKPHFFARDEDGALVDIEGDPDLVLATTDGARRYVDLLALESERLGEHPVHKVFRLEALGIAVEGGLLDRLRPSNFHDDLFQTLSFEYLSDQEASGVIAEVFHDGTFLIIPFGTQSEWQSDNDEIASPSHFHVDPRALSAADSALAAHYEADILALPFDDQRYPPVAVARQQCDVFTEAREEVEYVKVLASVGYVFTPAHVESGDDDAAAFGEKATRVLRQGSGQRISYFGFEPAWAARRLAELGAQWVGECDAAYGLRPGPGQDGAKVSYYMIARRSLEPNKTQRYEIMHVADDGGGRVLHSPPGIVLLAVPLPTDPNRWILSAEGWPAAVDGEPADPRFQAVYLADVDSPGGYDIVEYPISRLPRAPDGLYGSAPRLSDDSRYLINNLYGFEDEGGGLWVVDLEGEEFYRSDTAFSRIVPWDHALSWFVLGPADPDAGGTISVFLTAKEVDDDFAMTASLLQISGTGLDLRIESQRRLRRMVGWNPVPMAIQRLSENGYVVAVETHFNYEASLLPRARGVSLVQVDTGAVE